MSIMNDMMIKVSSEAGIGFVEQIKAWWKELHDRIVLWLASLDLTSAAVIETVSFAGVGFLVGFLLRKHLRLLLMFAALLAGALWALQEFNIVAINWDQAKQAAHLLPNDTLGSLFASLVVWFKAKMAPVIGFLVGFLIGYKA